MDNSRRAFSFLVPLIGHRQRWRFGLAGSRGLDASAVVDLADAEIEVAPRKMMPGLSGGWSNS